MKAFFTFCFLLISFQLVAQDSFEGVVKMNIDSPEAKNLSMEIHIKEDNIAILLDELEELKGEIKVIVNQRKNEMMMIIEEESKSMAMKYPLDALSELEDQRAGIPKEGSCKKAEDVPFNCTGKVKEIDGYKCEQCIYEDEEVRVEAWISNDLNLELEDLLPSIPGQTVSPMNLPDSLQGFPLELIVTEKDKKETVKISNRVSKEKVDDSFFTVPSDIEVIDMSAMLEMMKMMEALDEGK